MEEFNNRMNAQRNILKLINKSKGQVEELCGLSRKAIDRWISVNSIDPESHKCKIVYEISEKLFFLATKSQEQISDEYKLMSSEIFKLSNELQGLE
ncbi:MAG: hypothetical protein ACD_79C01416G0004 [uncultured bacterium]|nr:MAG: hypothetical protein ACD_79C01416G0004 [uncultured bacterium]